MRLTIEQIIRFQTDGILVVEQAFTEEDLALAIADVESEVDRRARRLFAEGKIKELHEGESYERRYILLHDQCAEIGTNFDIMHIRTEGFFNFLRNKRLLDIAECLLGSEIECNPIHHVRAKRPFKEDGKPVHSQNVPWHQDAAVTLEEANDSEIITFWVPLVDATAETGCMEVIPGAFKAGMLRHNTEGDKSLPDDLIPDMERKMAPCPKGGMIIMNKFTPHRGASNLSNRVRWSLDLRYHKTGMASGRPYFPSFVARSRSNPESELRDYGQWAQNWVEAIPREEGQRSRQSFSWQGN